MAVVYVSGHMTVRRPSELNVYFLSGKLQLKPQGEKIHRNPTESDRKRFKRYLLKDLAREKSHMNKAGRLSEKSSQSFFRGLSLSKINNLGFCADKSKAALIPPIALKLSHSQTFQCIG